MKLHANARTCPRSRRLLVRRVREEGWSVMAAAEAAGISERGAYRWLRRFREEGEAGLLDRCSAPRRIPRKTPVERVQAIESLRRLRMTAAEIAELLSMPISTGVVLAQANRPGQALAARASGAAPPLRARAARAARPCRRQEARPDRRARARPPLHRPQAQPASRLTNLSGNYT
jgi:transposase